MSRKTHEKQLARRRAKKAQERAQQKRQSRVGVSVVGALVVIAAILWIAGVFDRDGDPVAAGTDAPTPASTATASADPCPAPPSDAPTADTEMQFDEPPPASEAPEAATVLIATTCGDITVELDSANAPQAVANFLFLAEQGFYTGTPFHRVMPNFVIQGGDPTGTGSGGPGYQFDDELDHVATLFDEVDGQCDADPEVPCYAYPRGTLAMANGGADTNGSQFFVVQADPSNTWPAAYTPFGTVTSGMEVVDDIANGATTGPSNDLAVTPAVITGMEVSTGPAADAG